ncbi:hypothetical protein ACEW7C_003018 [Yersinia enterocolitica]
MLDKNNVNINVIEYFAKNKNFSTAESFEAALMSGEKDVVTLYHIDFYIKVKNNLAIVDKYFAKNPKRDKFVNLVFYR